MSSALFSVVRGLSIQLIGAHTGRLTIGTRSTESCGARERAVPPWLVARSGLAGLPMTGVAAIRR